MYPATAPWISPWKRRTASGRRHSGLSRRLPLRRWKQRWSACIRVRRWIPSPMRATAQTAPTGPSGSGWITQWAPPAIRIPSGQPPVPVRAKPGRLPRPWQSDPPFHSLLPESGTDCSSARFPIKTPRNCHPRQPRGVLFSPFSPGRCGKLPGTDSGTPLPRKPHGCVPGPRTAPAFPHFPPPSVENPAV